MSSVHIQDAAGLWSSGPFLLSGDEAMQEYLVNSQQVIFEAYTADLAHGVVPETQQRPIRGSSYLFREPHLKCCPTNESSSCQRVQEQHPPGLQVQVSCNKSSEEHEEQGPRFNSQPGVCSDTATPGGLQSNASAYFWSCVAGLNVRLSRWFPTKCTAGQVTEIKW